MRKGCLIAVLVVLAIIVVFVIVIWVNREKMVDKAMGTVHDMVVQALPEEYPQARVDSTFEDFIIAIKKGRVNKESMEALGPTVQRSLEDGQLTREEVDSILSLLRGAIERSP